MRKRMQNHQNVLFDVLQGVSLWATFAAISTQHACKIVNNSQIRKKDGDFESVRLVLRQKTRQARGAPKRPNELLIPPK